MDRKEEARQFEMDSELVTEFTMAFGNSEHSDQGLS